MEGYYQTPNVNIPYNDRPKGELAPIALAELEGWRAVANGWETYTDGRSNRCKECHQNIWFSKDPQGHEYQYSISEIEALVVAHLRQCHAEIGT
jgi:hypothetical protein